MALLSNFLIERLNNAGVGHIFGVPGQYSNKFLARVADSQIKLITTVEDSGAAHAADAYARQTGVGCVVVNYNDGAFKILNVVAGAYAESSPLIIISGAPATNDENAIKFKCQSEIFKKVTCASTTLNDPQHAGYEIDRVLEALKFYSQPIYIEVPIDNADKSIVYDVYQQGTPESPKSDPENLQEALSEVLGLIHNSQRPVILAGVEIARFDLGKNLFRFAQRANIPIATTLLSKSVVPENHPLYLGVYCGSKSNPRTKESVEGSDCLLRLGVMTGDTSIKNLPESIREKKILSCTVRELKIRKHSYDKIVFMDFVTQLLKTELSPKAEWNSVPKNVKLKYKPRESFGITEGAVFDKINSVLTENIAVVADGGKILDGCINLGILRKNGFIGSALYGAVGNAIPASIGSVMANPDARQFVVVSDTAFERSFFEIGTMSAYKLKPIIFVLNNQGRSSNWDYHKVVEAFGYGKGFVVRTESELDEAIDKALVVDGLSVINIILENQN